MARTPSPSITAQILQQFPDYNPTTQTATCPTHGPFTLDRTRPVCPLCRPKRTRSPNLTPEVLIARMTAAHNDAYIYSDFKQESARVATVTAECKACGNHFTVDVRTHSEGGHPCRNCIPFKPRGLSVKLSKTST